jgi:hypothetical protein
MMVPVVCENPRRLTSRPPQSIWEWELLPIYLGIRDYVDRPEVLGTQCVIESRVSSIERSYDGQPVTVECE